MCRCQRTFLYMTRVTNVTDQVLNESSLVFSGRLSTLQAMSRPLWVNCLASFHHIQPSLHRHL